MIPGIKTSSYVRKGPLEESRSAFVKSKDARPSQMIGVAREEAAQRNTLNARSILQGWPRLSTKAISFTYTHWAGITED